jgi:hypothetical protein
MKQPHICFAIAGLCFGASPKGLGQPSSRDSIPIAQATPCQPADKSSDSTSATCAITEVYKGPKMLRGIEVTGGQLTIPFKIRPKAEHGTFRLTTDVTLGAFIGLTKRLSSKKRALHHHSNDGGTYIYQHQRQQYLPGVRRNRWRGNRRGARAHLELRHYFTIRSIQPRVDFWQRLRQRGRRPMALPPKNVVVVWFGVFVYEIGYPFSCLRQGLITSRRLWSYVR